MEWKTCPELFDWPNPNPFEPKTRIPSPSHRIKIELKERAHPPLCPPHQQGKVCFMLFSKTEFTAVVSLAGLCAVLLWRFREGRTAVTARKLLIPPMGMATGFCMFFVRAFRFHLTWALGAFLIGAILLAWPLLRTSGLRREGDAIMMKRSGAFFAVIIVLAAVRYFARGYFDSVLTLEQTGGLFFVLAFGMILRWRLSLYLAYRALTSEPSISASPIPEEARN